MVSDKIEKKYFHYDAGSGFLKSKVYANEADIQITLVRGQLVDVKLIADYSIEREWYSLKYLKPRGE